MKYILSLIMLFCTAGFVAADDYHNVDRVRERIPTVRLRVFAPHNRASEVREFREQRIRFVDRHGRVVEEVRLVPVERQQVRERIVTHKRLVRRNGVEFIETRDNRGRLIRRERVQRLQQDNHHFSR